MARMEVNSGQPSLFPNLPSAQRKREFNSFKAAVVALANPSNFNQHRPRLDRAETVKKAAELAEKGGMKSVEGAAFSLVKPEHVFAAVEVLSGIPQFMGIAGTLKNSLPAGLRIRAERFLKP